MNKFMKILIGLYVRLIYIKRALKQIRKPHLGDVVDYNGERCFLNQGVNAPYWDLIWFDGFESSANVCSSIHESKFKLQPLWRRFFFSLRFTYRFYMGYWYGIDVQKKYISYLESKMTWGRY